jgi:hypothetical protein
MYTGLSEEQIKFMIELPEKVSRWKIQKAETFDPKGMVA